MVRLTLAIALALSASAYPARAEESLPSLIESYDEAKSPVDKFKYAFRATSVAHRTSELAREKMLVLRAALMMAAVHATMHTLHERGEGASCREVHKYISQIAPYSPTVEEAGRDIADHDFAGWPILLAMASVCHFQNSEIDKARAVYEMAAQFENVPLGERDTAALRKVLKMARSNLKSAEPYAVGSYVTNTGFLQEWIGRVVERERRGIAVRITYRRKESSSGPLAGETTKFAEDEVKPLKVISLEAMLEGWQ